MSGSSTEDGEDGSDGSDDSDDGEGKGSGSGDRGKPRSRKERRFEAAVRELQGCLPALSALEWSIAVTRTGIYRGRPAGREEVARRFEISVRRVRELERTILMELRAAAADGCDRFAAPPTATTLGVPPFLSITSLERAPEVATYVEVEDGSRASNGSQGSGDGGTDGVRPAIVDVAGFFREQVGGLGVAGPLAAMAVDTLSLPALILGLALLLVAAVVLVWRRSRLLARRTGA